MTTSGWHAALEYGLGSVELLLALVVIWHLRRFGKSLPWLAVLMVFFLIRGADRIYVGIHGSEPSSIISMVDGALILVLMSMLVGLRHTVRALEMLDKSARWRQQEYDRALADFRQLARHRLANPLTAITGTLDTLTAHPNLDDKLRADLLQAARDAADRLQNVALDPDPQGAEERGLEARPRLGSQDL